MAESIHGPGGAAALAEDLAGTLLQTEQRGKSLTVSLGNGIENDGADAIQVNPAGVAGSFLSEETATTLQVNTGNGLEGDGGDNIRVRGDQVAGNVMAEGTNPYEVDVNIGNGLENSTGTLRINPADVAGTGLTEDTATSLGIANGGVDTTQLAAQAVTPTEVDGSGGTSNQVLTTDGTATGTSWGDSPGGLTTGETALIYAGL